MNWERVTHIFQIPLRWFRDVDRRSWIIGDGEVLQVSRDNEGTKISVDKSALPGASKEVGSPTYHVDTEEDDDSQEVPWTWTAGGSDGVVFDGYIRCHLDDGWHWLSRARLTFSKDGLLVSAQGLAGRRQIQG